MTSKCEIDEYGDKIWRNEQGDYHNEDGPAIIGVNGSKAWLIKGKYHRIDGPAIIWYDGSKLWYINDKWHRIDGPAYIRYDGYKQWWINDEQYSFNQWLEQLVIQGYKTKDEILTMKLQGEENYE